VRLVSGVAHEGRDAAGGVQQEAGDDGHRVFRRKATTASERPAAATTASARAERASEVARVLKRSALMMKIVTCAMSRLMARRNSGESLICPGNARPSSGGRTFETIVLTLLSSVVDSAIRHRQTKTGVTGERLPLPPVTLDANYVADHRSGLDKQPARHDLPDVCCLVTAGAWVRVPD
jgi:hypothetical protein